ncbi:helix-turn-helix domain-containing protein [Variovorax robiniae]|uniref:Helix-turn-helix domain-containing protein n=1 Tax=Variovorax robiniae TaxID=1836199 RepID=A0ABU8X979_9BURK
MPTALVPHAFRRIPCSSFDSGAFAAHEALEAFQASHSPSWDVQTSDASARAQFHGAVHMWRADRLLVSAGRFGPSQIRIRREHHIRADRLDHYRVILVRQGWFNCDADGQQTRLTPGRFVITDMARTESSETSSDCVALFIPREQLDALLPAGMDIHGLVPGGMFAQLLVEHLLAMPSQMSEVTVDEAPGLSRATVGLVASSVISSPEAREQAGLAIQNGLLHRARCVVEQNLRVEGFGPLQLGKQLGVSRSSLYRLFEPLGGVSQYVKERRLAHAHELLCRGEGEQSIAALAEQFGFKTATHFSRAFREQFGYCAREAGKMTPNAPAARSPNAKDGLHQWLSATLH